MTDHILIERPEAFPGVFVIRLNRPEKKNAITSDMYRKMIMALHEAGHDSSIRAVVFLGSEGCFSAGNDMGDFLTYAMSGTKEPPAAVDFLKVLASFGKPLVSARTGGKSGGGASLTPFGLSLVARFRAMERAALNAAKPQLDAIQAEIDAA